REHRAEEEHEVGELLVLIDEAAATAINACETEHASGEKRQVGDHIEEVRDRPDRTAVRELVVRQRLRHRRNQECRNDECSRDGGKQPAAPGAHAAALPTTGSLSRYFV